MSTYWYSISSPDNRGLFGRMSNNNILHTVTYGRAKCGIGWQTIGDFQGWTLSDTAGYADVSQAFYVPFPGSTYNYRYSIAGHSGNGLPRQVPYKIIAKNTNSSIETQIAWGGVPSDGVWHDMTGSVALSPGNYKLDIRLGTDHVEKDYIKIDDIQLANYALGTACSAAVAPTPQPTSTVPTPTLGRNYLLNCNFEENDENDQPEYWQIGADDQYIYSATNRYIMLDTYSGKAVNPSQRFYWYGGDMYVKFSAQRSHSVVVQNIDTKIYYPISKTITDQGTGWRIYSEKVPVPAGNYEIFLYWAQVRMTNSTYLAPSYYDDVSVGAGGYATCAGSPHATATPNTYKTATVYASPTMFSTNTMIPQATQPYTSTPAGSGPSATPRPTYTLLPTFTPYPTFTPWHTPTASPPAVTATRSPWPTYTAQATYTPLPTLTLNPWQLTAIAPTTTTGAGTPTSTMDWPLATSVAQTLTPQPPDPTSNGSGNGLPTQAPTPQPPPSYYSDCQRPQDGRDMAGWLEFNQCQALSWFSWSPNAQATYEAFPTSVGGKEPFGSINEAQQGMNELNELIKNGDYGTPLPGVSTPASLLTFFDYENNTFLQTGKIEVPKSGGQPNMTCSTNLAGTIGVLSMGYCMFFNFLAEKGIMAWITVIINVCAIGFLLSYIWAKWIDAGSGAA